MVVKRRQSEQHVKLAPKFKSSCALLFEAAQYARHTCGDRWDFAVEIGELLKLGLTDNDLRYLLRLQYVEHASEIKASGQDDRKFEPSGGSSFNSDSCFVLTRSGVVASSRFFATADNDSDAATILRCSSVRECKNAAGVPAWDAEQRVLSFGGLVVKQFRWHAPNQETILSVLEEDGWPARIDDPLVPEPNQDIKRRLSDTIKALNRNQLNELIRFRGDGTGHAVIWEATALPEFNGITCPFLADGFAD